MDELMVLFKYLLQPGKGEEHIGHFLHRPCVMEQIQLIGLFNHFCIRQDIDLMSNNDKTDYRDKVVQLERCCTINSLP